MMILRLFAKASTILLLTFNLVACVTSDPNNNPPTASDLSLSAVSGEALAIQLSGSDPDGDPLTYEIVSGPDHGVLTGQAPDVVYTSESGYQGQDQFAYTVSDGQSTSDQATVGIQVSGGNQTNDPPSALDLTVSVLPGESVAIELSGLDPDGDPLTYEIVSGPDHGVLTGQAPNVVYTPDSGYQGPDQFAYTVDDGQLTSDRATVSIQVSPWQAPIGVPEPGFGIHETAPDVPDPWDAQTPGFYYVHRDHAEATDNNNAYGTPAKPRSTIPDNLPAGSVVEVHGVYDFAPTGYDTISGDGTDLSPIFIRGAGPGERPTIARTWQIKGNYIIFEHLEFADEDSDPSGGATGKLIILSPSHHVGLRKCEISGNLEGGGLGVASWDDQEVEQIVIWDNHIHHNGDVNANYDQDVHGVAVGKLASHIWILDNEMNHNSGDGLQINSPDGQNGAGSSHHIYVGRNITHHNKQTGLWCKQASDVIFSQNTSYAHRPSGSSGGAGMGFQYGPERVWFLFNEIFDCDVGISSGSNSVANPGQDAYLIGNLIYDIHHSGSWDPNSGWSPAAISLWGSINRHVVGNTIYDVDAGITTPSSGPFEIADNIIANITESEGMHVFLEPSDGAAASELHHNLFEGVVRIRWGSSTVYDLDGLKNAFPGKGEGCLNEDPLFANQDNGKFTLDGNSQAIDKSVAHPVYDTFLATYGLDIRVDFNGRSRPYGLAWDMGAFEQ